MIYFLPNTTSIHKNFSCFSLFYEFECELKSNATINNIHIFNICPDTKIMCMTIPDTCQDVYEPIKESCVQHNNYILEYFSKNLAKFMDLFINYFKVCLKINSTESVFGNSYINDWS